MAYTTIDKGSLYFNTSLWTGNGSTQSITGVGFAPDCVWLKGRSAGYDHQRYDTVRGALQVLRIPTGNEAEGTQTGGLTSFDSDGFSLGNNGRNNASGATYVAWNWLAGGTASSNTDGTLTTSVSANTTSGFSICTYTGNKTSGATIGHGLGVAPSMVIIKNRTASTDHHLAYHKNIGNTKFLYYSLDNGELTSSQAWNNTTPDSSVVTLGNSDLVNGSGENLVAWCYAEVKGFSKFGSYTGNGNANGTFIYTGFKPAFVMTKRTDTTGSWYMTDNKRDTDNVVTQFLYQNLSNSETTDTNNQLDFLSNGFKRRNSFTGANASGGTYIYMAFAENPFTTSTGIPVTAR